MTAFKVRIAVLPDDQHAVASERHRRSIYRPLADVRLAQHDVETEALERPGRRKASGGMDERVT